jgi:tetratricopeptide (TPR) repeat protein
MSRKCAIAAILVALFLMTTYGAIAQETGSSDDSLIVLYNNLGVMQALNGYIHLGRLYLDSAARIDVANAALQNNIANCLLCLGDVESALEHYERAYEMEQGNTDYLFNWGIALHASGETEEAVSKMRSYLGSIESDAEIPDFASALFEGLELSKGSAQTITKEEIRKLLEKAKLRRDMALTKLAAADSIAMASDSIADTVVDSTLDSAAVMDSSKAKQRSPRKQIAPAGEKSSDFGSMSRLLYWAIL